MTDDLKRTRQRTSRQTVKRIGKLVSFFREHDEFTQSEAAMACGLHKETVAHLIREMWRPGPDRTLRICYWRDDAIGRPTIRVYEFGAEPDAKRRPPVSAKVRTQMSLMRKEQRAQMVAQHAILAMASPTVAEAS